LANNIVQKNAGHKDSHEQNMVEKWTESPKQLMISGYDLGERNFLTTLDGPRLVTGIWTE